MRRFVAWLVLSVAVSVPAVGMAQEVDEQEQEAEQEAEETSEEVEQEAEETGDEAEEATDEAAEETEEAAEETEEAAEETEQELGEASDEADEGDEGGEVTFGPSVEEGDDDSGGGHVGIIGGPGLTNITADDDDFETVSNNRVGYSLGLQFGLDFNEFFGLAPELLFSRRGWETSGEAAGVDFNSDYMFSYLEVPLLLRIGVPLDGALAPKVLIGPHGSLFLDGERDGEAGGPFLNGTGETDIDPSDVNPWQFGVTAAVGIDFNLEGSGVLTTDVRFVRNFTGTFDVGDGEENVYHQSWYVMGGLMF